MILVESGVIAPFTMTLNPGETAKSLLDRISVKFQFNYQSPTSLMDVSNNRVVGVDEPLIDDRIYYLQALFLKKSRT